MVSFWQLFSANQEQFRSATNTTVSRGRHCNGKVVIHLTKNVPANVFLVLITHLVLVSKTRALLGFYTIYAIVKGGYAFGKYSFALP